MLTNQPSDISRRQMLAGLAGIGLTSMVPSTGAAAPLHMRAIPKTGEMIPAIGMGTWITFNVGRSEALRRQRLEVLQTFFATGGGMIDSSPMYGSSQAVIGWCLQRLQEQTNRFTATKIWTSDGDAGTDQMTEAEALWAVDGFDLMQIHNLLSWEEHLETLLAAKAAGRIRYIGITTSHGSRHGRLEQIMRDQPIDFVQFSYNVLDREAEARLLPLARERRLAVIINRPFQTKGLFRQFGDKPLPNWAGEIDCANWAQFFLKFVISHPDVTCAIPATSKVAHMQQNMGALQGPLPDAEMRRRMVQYVESL